MYEMGLEVYKVDNESLGFILSKSSCQSFPVNVQGFV